MINSVKKLDSNKIMIVLLFFAIVFFVFDYLHFFQISCGVFLLGGILIFFVIIVIHGWKTLGSYEMLVFLLIAYSIALLYEYTEGLGWGELVDFRLDYSDLLGPKFLGKVPYSIPLVWALSCYCAFTMTNIIFNRVRTNQISEGKISLRWFITIFGMGIVSGLIMASWDLIVDPVMVAMGAWSWPNGGSYYGIPLWNYEGWVEIPTVIFIAFNFFLQFRKRNQVFIGGNKRSIYTLLVVVIYSIALLFYVILAILEEVTYVIPWATIAMGLVIIITIVQFQHYIST